MILKIDIKRCCDKNFKTKQGLTRHIDKHDGVNNYFGKCEICGKTFISKNGHDQHKSVHSSDRSFKCKQCLKAFKTKGSLYSHMKIHGERKYKCQECGSKFYLKAKLDRHFRNVHMKPEYLFGCNICSKHFQDKDTLRKHIQTVHGCENN